MPLRLNVGVSRKIGLPDYCSVGASCDVEFELSQELLDQDLEGFQNRIRTAYGAAHRAVHDELARLQSLPAPAQEPARNGSSRTQAENGLHSAPSEPSPAVRDRNARALRPTSRAPRSYATVRQIGALRALARQTSVDLSSFLRDEYGVDRPELLSIAQASELIDQLKAASES